ncbi:MAG: hypothetical protein M3354_09190 [Chloroflexota bacterium]|nr:hypothetical protein [Chloroflexota bacterium]
MKHSMIEQSDAPARPPERGKRRVSGMDELVETLMPGKVARIEIEEDEKQRNVTEQLFKTAARSGKLVDVWEVGGILYAQVLTPTQGS